MLNIYAHAMQTATRTNGIQVSDSPRKVAKENKKSRWPSVPRWWVQSGRNLDLDKL